MLIRYGLCWLLSWGVFSLANAAPPYVMNIDSQPEPLGLHLDYLEDKTGELSIEQVASPAWQAKFTAVQSAVPSFETHESFYWFRLTIDNQFLSDEDVFLVVRAPPVTPAFLDTPIFLDAYTHHAAGWLHTQTNHLLPFNQRAVALTEHAVPVHLHAQQQQQIYIRVKIPGEVYLPIVLMTAEQLIAEQTQKIWFPAVFYGALAILALYNLFIFLYVRNNIYLYYIAFNFMVILTNMFLRGYSFQYLWPAWPALTGVLGGAIIFSYWATFSLLTQKLLQLKRYSVWLHHAMSSIIALMLLLGLLTFILPDVIYPVFSPLAALGVPLWALFVSVYVAWKGGRVARYLLVGWVMVIVSTVIFVLSTQEVLPANFWTTNLPECSILLFSVIVSLVLADRINTLRMERMEAQQQALLEAQEKQQIAEHNLQLQNDNIRMSTELDVTRQLQAMVLPSPIELRQVKSLDIACCMEPADEVGGDYYDVLQYQDKIIISIGDVTGHGLASGVLMIMVQTAVRALSISNSTDFFQALNQTIYDNVQRMGIDKNLTLVILNYKQGKLSISGQHEEVLIIRSNGELQHIDTLELGFMIGVTRDIEQMINSCEVELEPGDGIVLYTDGITEAFDGQRQQYGLERLCEVIQQHWSKPAQDIRNAVLKDFHQYVGSNKIMDDFSLMVIKQLAA